MDLTTLEFNCSKLQEHLAKLSSGVAIIKVEVREKDRYDDTLNTICTAVGEVILPGGSVALLKASLMLAMQSLGSGSTGSPFSPDTKPIPTQNFDQELRVAIILNADMGDMGGF
ncbi:hypothetical protein BDZ94DRAFT_627854 [Collybia nuda]|uniref:Uncharacterized protein n=1 Tax=Collybia nuda TaxID=64659 RepID=A0A9P5Y4K7_9AGAR|nr:hypothetical protein BDZ94DRAFT_627854 [Collybia nuda]